MEEIHGHELIGLIAQQGRAMSLEEIKAMAEKEIGANVAYYTCSLSGMDTDAMIAFLLNRKKLVQNGNGWVLDTGNVCNHD